ncbi:MAG: hypothetical protein WBQ66_06545 [Blastocatellia bacterium]
MLPNDVKHLAADPDGSVFASDGGRRIARLTGGWLTNAAILPADARISAIAGHPNGGVVVADAGLNRIWLVSPAGKVHALAGVEQPPGLGRKPVRSDGPASEARFRSPTAIASNDSGELFVAEPGGDRIVIRTIFMDSVTTDEIVGLPHLPALGLAVVNDALCAVFGIGDPPSVVVLRRGERADSGASDLSWRLAMIVGSRTQRGSADGPGTDARFAAPSAISATPGGCALTDGARIRLILDVDRVTTVAGSTPGYLDGHGTSARFGLLRAIACTPDGRLFVADPHNDALRVVTLEGEVSTVIGALRSDRISVNESTVVSKAFGNAIVDDNVREAWGIARVFLRDHRLGAQPWPDRTIQPTSVASARLGKELSTSWSQSDDPDRSGVGLFCLWLIECDERDQGVNEIRDHRLRRTGQDLDRRAG